MKNKTLAAWLAFLGGPLGIHRFYLHGLGDWLGWLLPIPTALGLYGIRRARELGLDDLDDGNNPTYHVKDLGSRNGTKLNGVKIVDAPLRPGDVIKIGNHSFTIEEEATLKRLRKKGASIALEAANPAYETRIFGPDRVRIQGRLVALMRRY